MPRFPTASRRVVISALTLAITGIAGTAAGVTFHAAATSATPAALTTAAASTPGAHTRVRRVPLLLARLVLRATMKQTGLTRAAVMQDLRAGESFATIAGAKQSAVENDVLAALQARLTKAVNSHRITQQQADARLAAAKTALPKLMAADLSGRFARHAPATPRPTAAGSATSV